MSVMLGMLVIVVLLLGALWYLRSGQDTKVKTANNEELWHLRNVAHGAKKLAQETLILDEATAPTLQAQALLDEIARYEQAKQRRQLR